MREPRRDVRAEVRTIGNNKAACDENAAIEIQHFFTPTSATPISDIQDLHLVSSDYRRSSSDVFWEGTYRYMWTERE